MKESFKIWFKTVPEIWKFLGAASGFVILVSTVTLKIDHIKNKNMTKDERIEQFMKTDSTNHAHINVFMDQVLIKLNNQSDSIKTMNKGIRILSTVNSNMQNYLESKVATKDGLKEVQKIFDVEKKKYNFDWVPPTQQNMNITSDMK